MLTKKARLIVKIKDAIIGIVLDSGELPKVKFSCILSESLHYDYTYLANLFSETEGTSIEHYMLVYKIEKVKELLLCDDLSLTQIAKKLHYSSVAHLSNQFKKITGITPSFFKSINLKKLITPRPLKITF